MSNKKLSIKSIDEVLEIIEGIFHSRTHLELGQEFDTIVQKSWSIIENINQHSYDLAIRPKDQSNQFNFSKKSKISISNQAESVQFDVNLKKLNHKNLIIVEMPKELELISTRLAKRHHLEHLDITIRYKNLSEKSFRKRNRLMDAKLEDLSVNGISLKLPYDSKNQYNYADKITINSVNGYSLPTVLEGNIVYLQDFLKKPDEAPHTKIGVKFEKQIEMNSVLRYLNTANYLNKLAS